MEKTIQRLLSFRQGHSPQSWHRSAIRFHILSVIISLTILTCFIISSTNGGAFGTTQLFSGRCSHAVNINKVLQAVLALLAIGISVSFDYFMRLVLSPTVDDLRRAHIQGQAFDIGVQSIRNLRQISHWRTFVWVMLISLAVPIQLLFHSITFVCFSSTDYSRFEVSEAFTTGQHFSYPGVGFLGHYAFDQTIGLQSQFEEILPSLRSASSDWEKLNVKDCARINFEEADGIQSHRNLILVVQAGPDIDARGWTGADVWDRTTPPANANETPDYYDSKLVNSLWSFSLGIYCDAEVEVYENLVVFEDSYGGETGYDEPTWKTSCGVSYDDDTDIVFETMQIWDSDHGRPRNISWTGSALPDARPSLAFRSIRVKYCLSEPYQAPCKIYASNFFLLVSLICTLLGFIISVLVSYYSWSKETCQSIGDALQVFLKDGESFIQASGALPSGCNATSGEFSAVRWTPVLKWHGTRPKWGQTVSTTTWTCTLDKEFGDSMSNRKLTLKDVSGSRQFEPGNQTVKLAVYCIIVNAPQMAVSIFYFSFTSIYSSLFQGKYWADFVDKAQQLRVSFRQGEQQECTPALQFPRVWGVSFVLLKAAIGWSMTQTFYLLLKAKVTFWHPEIEIDNNVEMFLGYSLRAAFLTIALVSLAALIPFFLSMRSLPSNSLVVGNDSAAIAAHCPSHNGGIDNERPLDGQNGAIAAWEDVWRSRRHLQPLRWGVLNSGSATLGRPGVLGLGTEDEVLGSPVEGQYYVLVAGHFRLYTPTRCAEGI